ncbi:MAG: alpha/beta hydrolase fold domain-containing protein [Acidimicrobiia bacterium]
MATDGWNLPALRGSAREASADLVARRSGMAAFPAPPPAEGVSVTESTIGGVTCYVCEPGNANASIVYFHGGGYRLGSAQRSSAFGSRLAKATGARVVVVTYRLAPEHPFPAALYDATAVYGAVVAESTVPVFVSGDSAGGGLAAAVVVACAYAGKPKPSGAILFSPWIDLRVVAATYDSRAATDTMFSRVSATEAADTYLQGHDAGDPLASPLLAPASIWPPTLVFAGGDEVLLDDSVGLIGVLASGGITVEAHLVAGMQHVWPTLFPDLPESSAALDACSRFVREHAARSAVNTD